MSKRTLYVVVAFDSDPTIGRILGPYEDFVSACEKGRGLANEGLYSQPAEYALNVPPAAEIADVALPEDEGERRAAMAALRLALVRLVPEKRSGDIPQKRIERVLVELIDEYRRANATERSPRRGLGLAHESSHDEDGTCCHCYDASPALQEAARTWIVPQPD